MRGEIGLFVNAGCRVVTPDASFYIDAFHRLAFPAADRLRREQVPEADLILVTHDHWDHFDAELVARAAEATGAAVIGPRSVIRKLMGKVGPEVLFEMEPPAAADGEPARCVRAEFPAAAVTAYRTFHGREHNSYLVETPHLRFFHDGDNEDTRRIEVQPLGRLDALLIGPWLGGGWVEFIESVDPERSFLIHLDEDEFRQHGEGKFLPGICDHVPCGLMVLKPGDSYVFE